MANRTKKGNVTADARKEHGTKGKFPVFDEQSARSAIKLRHHGRGISASSVLSKVARWAKKNNKPAISRLVEVARKRDKGVA